MLQINEEQVSAPQECIQCDRQEPDIQSLSTLGDLAQKQQKDILETYYICYPRTVPDVYLSTK